MKYNQATDHRWEDLRDFSKSAYSDRTVSLSVSISHSYISVSILKAHRAENRNMF